MHSAVGRAVKRGIATLRGRFTVATRGLGVLLLLVNAVSLAARADDWPQWLGPRRDGVWRERGIVERLDGDAVRVRWRAPVALGYAGPAVAGGRVFVMDYVLREGKIQNNPGARDQLDGAERVLCFDAADGRLIWKHEYDRPYHISFGGGPRATVTVDGDRIYALGAEGNLWCLRAADGSVEWAKDFAKDYGAETPFWGHAAHPLVDGDALYCLVGGKGSVAVAFDKATGRELWRALDASQQGYCPPTMIEQGGRKTLLVWHAEALCALDPTSGAPRWSVELQPAYGMAIAAPRQRGDLVFASGYGDAAVLLRLGASGAAPQVLWRGGAKKALYSTNATPHFDDGVIYGCDAATGALMAIAPDDGRRLWQTTEPTLGATGRGRYGTAFLVRNEDRYFLMSETGELILARLKPDGYAELGRAKLIEPTNEVFGRKVLWSHPAFSDRGIFVRNDNELIRADLAVDDSTAP